jgi:hypothetical protein
MNKLTSNHNGGVQCLRDYKFPKNTMEARYTASNKIIKDLGTCAKLIKQNELKTINLEKCKQVKYYATYQKECDKIILKNTHYELQCLDLVTQSKLREFKTKYLKSKELTNFDTAGDNVTLLLKKITNGKTLTLEEYLELVFFYNLVKGIGDNKDFKDLTGLTHSKNLVSLVGKDNVLNIIRNNNLRNCTYKGSLLKLSTKKIPKISRDDFIRTLSLDKIKDILYKYHGTSLSEEYWEHQGGTFMHPHQHPPASVEAPTPQISKIGLCKVENNKYVYPKVIDHYFVDKLHLCSDEFKKKETKNININSCSNLQYYVQYEKECNKVIQAYMNKLKNN